MEKRKGWIRDLIIQLHWKWWGGNRGALSLTSLRMASAHISPALVGQRQGHLSLDEAQGQT